MPHLTGVDLLGYTYDTRTADKRIWGTPGKGETK